MNKNKVTSSEILGWLFNVPYLIYTVIFFGIPLIWAFWLSFLDWNLMSKTKKFVGLKNFISLFSDDKVKAAFSNSFKYLFCIVVLTVIGAFIVALLSYNLPSKIKGFVSVLFFIPYLTSGVATAVVVRFLLSYNSVLNVFLREQMNININWFQDKFWSFFVMVALVVWKMSGYYSLFILSALEGISDDVHEAAMLDGSTNIHKLIHILIPMILPNITTVVVLAAGIGYSIFTEPYLLTGGGPLNSTTTWMLEIYNVSFVKFQSGYGAAMALTCAVLIFITIRVITFGTDKLNNKYGF